MRANQGEAAEKPQNEENAGTKIEGNDGEEAGAVNEQENNNSFSPSKKSQQDPGNCVEISGNES